MNLEDRIKLLNPDYFTNSDQEITIKEESDQGKASLLLKITRRCLALHKADERKIVFLKNQSVADCIILELDNEKAVALHIFEFKRTIRKKSLEKTQKQFEGAFFNALGLLGILGLDLPANILFYSAYSKVSLDAALATRKQMTGVPITETACNISNWQKGVINVAWIENAKLEKIQWDWETEDPRHFSLPKT